MQNTIHQTKSNRAYWLQVIILGLLVGLGLQFVQAWTAPSATPPGGNVAGPLTTSNVGQSKEGNLSLNTSGTFLYGLLVPYGNVGIGTIAPTTNLDINGQIRIRGGTPVANQVLTTDATGLATWEPPTPGNYQVSCARYLSGNTLCLRVDAHTGATTCMQVGSAGVWVACSSPFVATTPGNYQVSCDGYLSGNALCLRTNADTGAATCMQVGSAGVWVACSSPF